jgi:hypothetical protein
VGAAGAVLTALAPFLALCFLSALFGWAGGRGALWSIRANIGALEDFQAQLDIRLKRREGTAGQVVRQEKVQREKDVMEELRRRAAEEALRQPRPPPGLALAAPDNDGIIPLSSAEKELARRLADGKK